MATYHELNDVCTELQHIYSDNHDIDNLKDVQQLYRDARSCMTRKEQQSQDVIAELIENTKTMTDAANEDHNQKYLDQQNLLKEKCANAESTIEQLKQSLDNETNKLKEASSTVEALNAEKDAEASQAQQEVPVVRSTLKLYNNITNIQWDYESTDRIKGFCHMPISQDIRKFDIDPIDDDEWPASKVADQLWEAMWLDYVHAN